MMESYQIFIAIVVLLVFYFYRKHKNNFWKQLGVYCVPGVPVFGSDLKFTLGLETNMESQGRKYKNIGDRMYGGSYLFAFPFLFVKDPSMVEDVLVKDFVHFYDRGLPVNEKADPLQANLFNLAGRRWKHLRNKLSPVFTSGKLKTMHQQIIDCADILIEVLEKYVETGEPCDFKDTVSKFTTDVIGSCAYGLNMNSLKDEKNEFRRMGLKVFETGLRVKARALLRQMLRSIHPKLVPWLNMKAMSKELDDFFTNLVKDTIRLRESDPKYVRNDFVQLLINLKKEDDLDYLKGSQQNEDSENVVLDYKIMAANAFIFFVAGFETTASTMSYCLFELSKDQELQDKLHDEIKDVLEQHGGQPTYEAIKNMPLLDMVISETLRKYPPAPNLLRICTEPYKLPDCDIILPKGTRVEIPVYSLHHDPAIYPDPESFLPQRFSPENKHSIPKGAYLPFGDGPRICIGARFAQMEVKVGLSKILMSYKVKKSARMPDPIQFDPKSLFIMMPKGGIWLDVQNR